MKSFLKELAILTSLSMLLGTAANLFLPMSIPWVEDWAKRIEAKALEEGLAVATAEQVNEVLQKGGYLLFDARPRTDYRTGRIPTAISFPYDALETEFQNLRVLLTPNQPVITYCSGPQCDESFELARFLKTQGFTNVSLYVDGFPEWVKLGYPVEGKAE